MQDVIDGNEDAVKAYVELRKADNEVKKALEEINGAFMDEVQKEGATFKRYGAQFIRKNGTTRYSFKNIPIWIEANKVQKDIEAAAKLAYKNSQSGNMSVSESGEIIELPLVTFSSDSVSFKLL